ncbi:hypothetical protein HYPSUDRAFT_49427 [Hypholoma sublateritium FD-334 SS-4]|uniref:Uncharacterized protein n=1 Tax=Hypholoma sublateritium (strain FD-334 SS-4) TaxID=945553 RepID=A0A0D2N4P4_HYPSF|nr:hypothetical protein HYPSUDRAFT_49427 [Hypholoma sublateritium FD-334 SS-4]
MFLFSRYFIIGIHIVSRSIEAVIVSNHDINESFLRVWYTGQVIVAALAVSALEIVLMARVYALYNQPRWLAILLLVFLIVEIAVAIVGLSLNLPGHHFTPSLLISFLPRSFAYFGLCSVSIQCIVLVLTMRKYAKSSLQAIPLVQLMVRDGTLAFVMLAIFSLTVVVYTLCNISYAVTGYAWLLSATSCATCRLIINMQTHSTSLEPPGTSTTLIFTTIFTDRMAFESLNPTDTEIEMNARAAHQYTTSGPSSGDSFLGPESRHNPNLSSNWNT